MLARGSLDDCDTPPVRHAKAAPLPVRAAATMATLHHGAGSTGTLQSVRDRRITLLRDIVQVRTPP